MKAHNCIHCGLKLRKVADAEGYRFYICPSPYCDGIQALDLAEEALLDSFNVDGLTVPREVTKMANRMQKEKPRVTKRERKERAMRTMERLAVQTGIDNVLNQVAGGLEAYSEGDHTSPRLDVRWKSDRAYFDAAYRLMEMCADGINVVGSFDTVEEWRKARQELKWETL